MSNVDISPGAVDLWVQTHGLSPAMCEKVRALSAALTQSRAETAAAYEAAVQVYFGGNWPWYPDAEKAIRALVTADQRAALDAVLAEARQNGMRDAAQICKRQSELFASTEYATGQPLSSISERMACDMCQNAILAAISKGGAE